MAIRLVYLWRALPAARSSGEEPIGVSTQHMWTGNASIGGVVEVTLHPTLACFVHHNQLSR